MNIKSKLADMGNINLFLFIGYLDNLKQKQGLLR